MMEIKPKVLEKVKLTINDVIQIISSNVDIINPAYSELNFEVSLSDDRLSILIPTKFRKLPNKKYVEKIKELFKADECFYLPKMTDDPLDEPFWYIEYVFKDVLENGEGGGSHGEERS